MGLLRIILALSVVAGHTQSTVFGFNGIGATYAVPVFFVVSGFYMALILNGKYITLPTRYFYLSRALRIYPLYLIGFVLSIIVSYSDIRATFESLTSLSRAYMLISNATIFGRDIVNQVCWKTLSGTCASPLSMSINPPGWSLTPELLFYLAAPFIVKSKRNVILTWILGCAYFWIISTIKYPIDWNGISTSRSVTFDYTFFPASIVYFMTGVLGYHFIYSKNKISYPLCLIMVLSLAYTVTPFASWVILLLGIGVPIVFQLTKDVKIDRFIGELSYPVYILHFPIFLLVKKASLSTPVFSLGTDVALLTILASVITYMTIDKKISNFRHGGIVINHSTDDIKKSEYSTALTLTLYCLVPIAWAAYIGFITN